MTERVVAVLVTTNPMLAPELAAAMVEDVIDMVTEMPRVVPAVVLSGSASSPTTWPGTPVVGVAADGTVAQIVEVLGAAYEERPSAVAVVAGDAPDLPPLLIGKLFSPLGGAASVRVAVCPAADGGLVAIATRLPVPSWLTESGVSLDHPSALERLQEVAPSGALSVGPGWHRVRRPEDASRLDPGLDGWDATRAHLDM